MRQRLESSPFQVAVFLLGSQILNERDIVTTKLLLLQLTEVTRCNNTFKPPLFALLFLIMFTAACSNETNTDQSAAQHKNISLTISAAASLKDALTDIQKQYEKKHPNIDLKFNFGASGSLQQQITNGAPVDLFFFFSAAEDKFDALVKAGAISKENGTDLVGNDLVLIVPKNNTSAITNFEDLSKPTVQKIALGIPESVPAGQYAKETFEHMNLWKNIEPQTVYAKDVRQVLSLCGDRKR